MRILAYILGKQKNRNMKTRKIHRTTKPKEINLKQFYEMGHLDRKTHIDALHKLEFKDLSQTDLGVVFLWYQNWLLEDWPEVKTNFFSLNENEPQQENASIRVDYSASILDEQDELIKEIPTYTKEYLKDYIMLIFEDYPNWEWDLKSTTIDKFISSTNNFYKYTEYEKEILREFVRR